MDLTATKQTLSQYISLKSELELLTNRTNELKKRLTEDVEALGEVDDRGHTILKIDDVSLIKQKRVSKSLDINVAETVLTEKGIKDKCIIMVPTLDDAAIMAAFYEGDLTESDIDTMFPAKVSYAFLVKE